jgi:hypothetical protein
VGGKDDIQQASTMKLAKMPIPHQSLIFKCTKIILQISQKHSAPYIYLKYGRGSQTDAVRTVNSLP